MEERNNWKCWSCGSFSCSGTVSFVDGQAQEHLRFCIRRQAELEQLKQPVQPVQPVQPMEPMEGFYIRGHYNPENPVDPTAWGRLA